MNCEHVISGCWAEYISVIKSLVTLVDECGYMTTLCLGNTDERPAFYSCKAKQKTLCRERPGGIDSGQDSSQLGHTHGLSESLCVFYTCLSWTPSIEKHGIYSPQTFWKLLADWEDGQRSLKHAGWGEDREAPCTLCPALQGPSGSSLSDMLQGWLSSVFYGPIMCEILPMRGKLSA